MCKGLKISVSCLECSKAEHYNITKWFWNEENKSRKQKGTSINKEKHANYCYELDKTKSKEVTVSKCHIWG